MAQAKTLNDKELRIVLATIAQKRHSARNRAMVPNVKSGGFSPSGNGWPKQPITRYRE